MARIEESIDVGATEQLGAALGMDSRRVQGDLQRFKELIEQRGSESGA